MTPIRFLKISLGANAILGALVIALFLRQASPKPITTSILPAPAPARTAPALGASPGDPAPGSRHTLAWEDSMSELRRAGVPSDIIAKLVVEKIAQKWTPIEAGLEQKYLHAEIDARRLAEFHDQRASEEEAALRSALGDSYHAWDVEHTVGNMYLGGYVPAEGQKEPIYRLEKEHLARLQELEVAKRNNAIDATAFETAHARIELEFKTNLAAIVGSDRVDGLHQTDPAKQVLADFGQLGLNESQMREIAAVNEKWSSARADMARSLEQTATMDSAYAGDLQALDRARDGEYRRVLGDERFDAWQRAADDRFRMMQENATAWKLDSPTIVSVYSAIRAYDLAVTNREYQAQIAEQAGETIDWAKVQADIASMSHDAEVALRTRLGDERFSRLSRAEIISLRKPDLAKSALNERPHL